MIPSGELTFAHTSSVLLILGIAAVGASLTSLEYLCSAKHNLNLNGLFDWDIFMTRVRFTTSDIFAVVGKPWVYHLAAVLRLLASLVILIAVFWSLWSLTADPTFSQIIQYAVWVAAITSAYFSIRFPFGQDGSDQLTLIIFASFCLFSLLSHQDASLWWIWFIAFQGFLAYSSAGISKLLAARWRCGKAIVDIYSTSAYGNSLLHGIVKTSPKLAWLTCWLVIVIEMGVLALPFFPKEYVILYCITVLSFHLATAIFMSLNSFFWAFAAVQPALIQVFPLFNSFIQG